MTVAAENPFVSVAHTPRSHFRLKCYDAVLELRERVDDSLERFPFLRDYFDEVETVGVAAEWEELVQAWEDSAGVRLPLVELRSAAGLGDAAVELLFVIGLVEEDARFGALFEAEHGMPAQHRPTLGLLQQWWPEARVAVRRLAELGLVEAASDDVPRAEAAVRVMPVVWDVLRGDVREDLAPWARYRRRDALVAVDDLIASPDIARAVSNIPAVVEEGSVGAIVVRGPEAGGRRTVAGVVARSLGCGVLEVTLAPGDAPHSCVGALATLLRAVPLLVVDVPPGETASIPRFNGWVGPLVVVTGRTGGLVGSGIERSVTLELEIPDPALRALHWRAALGNGERAEIDALSERFRMTGGNVRRTAALARAEARLDGRTSIRTRDAVCGARTLHSQLLDTLADRVRVVGDWSRLAVADVTMRELRLLESRCRNRERLHELVGPALADQLTPGVRALFTGPSGTGKTLAARLLAASLDLDLYRLDLSLVVNKYLGETEKNLSRIFARAEEADAALLLDEGDALLTQRTAVQTSNDRYANLETNYLLQRLETFEGILIVTTNAGDRIDAAFRRRMDVIVEFTQPDPAERWAIWQLHLPHDHLLDEAFLGEVAFRCSLTGGEIRNAVLHASLLAFHDGCAIAREHIDAAVRREYAKAGAVCPLAREEPSLG